MVPLKPGRYEYRPESLVEIRNGLGLKQIEMAGLLGIPANTLWRWETGATKPDAESLAAIYSLAVEQDVTPKFFRRRPIMPKPNKQRSRLIVTWDFQNVSLPASQIETIDEKIENRLDQKFRSASEQLFKAFASPSQANATDKLQDQGWRVWEDNADLDEEIANHARSDCGQDPENTTFILITKDGDFVDLIQDLRDQGVQVYLMGITARTQYSQALAGEVGKKYRIELA